jgi:hypothetical protein
MNKQQILIHKKIIRPVNVQSAERSFDIKMNVNVAGRDFVEIVCMNVICVMTHLIVNDALIHVPNVMIHNFSVSAFCHINVISVSSFLEYNPDKLFLFILKNRYEILSITHLKYFY